jgi:hypothetical protein
LVGVKAAAVALAVAVAGVALAAGTGVLPNPLNPVDAPPNSATPATPPDTPWSTTADRRSSTPPGSSPGASVSPSAGTAPGTSASPGAPADHASLVGLCRAYQARGDRDPGAAMGSAAFAALVAAAGGADQVPTFCADLLAAEEPSGDGNSKSDSNGATTAPAESGGAGQSHAVAPDEPVVE